MRTAILDRPQTLTLHCGVALRNLAANSPHSNDNAGATGRSAQVKRALISDIHSNLEALEAVLADIRGQGISEIYCLGDIIGYGSQSARVHRSGDEAQR